MVLGLFIRDLWLASVLLLYKRRQDGEGGFCPLVSKFERLGFGCVEWYLRT